MCKGDRQNVRSATELSDCVHPAIEVPFGNQKRRKERPDERRTKKGKVISREKSKRRKDYRE